MPAAMTIIPLPDGRFSVAVHISPVLSVVTECDGPTLLVLVERFKNGEV